MNLEPKKKTLLQKFQIPIENLDYKYIENCSNVTELGRMLRILRSGEEGYYPDLQAKCENRLQLLDPKNKLLRKITPPCRSSELSEDQKQDILDDLGKSFSRIKILDDELREREGEVWDLPDVRQVETTKHKQNDYHLNVPKKKASSVKPRTYSEWDKFDVQKELEKLDAEENPKISVPKPKIDPIISRWESGKEERLLVAERERFKGNEAYAAGDYEEAKIYYDRSLSAHLNPITLNNRAQMYIKMKNYNSAIEDCNQVLLLEPQNIKALLRRGTAYKSIMNYEDALKDFEQALELQPNNEMAQKLVLEMRKKLSQNIPEQKTRILIEEI